MNIEFDKEDWYTILVRQVDYLGSLDADEIADCLLQNNIKGTHCHNPFHNPIALYLRNKVGGFIAMDACLIWRNDDGCSKVENTSGITTITFPGRKFIKIPASVQQFCKCFDKGEFMDLIISYKREIDSI